ncbi:MAG TPA: condensation domain-containing protein, partial [Thermoanaerobaculia bacterium]|nr:condensation domain-containing protein [Thermoanaerobaculia bacterium]
MEERSKTLAGLDARKRHLLSLLLKEKGVDPLQAPIPVQPRNRDTFPLSFEQERLWIIEQIEPGNVAYNLPLGLRLEGELRVGDLAATIGEIVRRHQTLRTTYAAVGGRPVQIVAPPAPFRIPIADLTGLPEELREAETVRLAAEESLLPFDIGRGVLRVHLLRLAAAEHALLFTVHHIASDGWSNGILVREVMALYEAYSAGRPSPLPDLPVQYVDFAVWQRDTFRGELLERQLSYWRDQLSGAPVLELPTDRPRPAVPSLAGAQEGIQLGAALAEGLRGIGREEGATLFMLVAAALQTLLARYAGQTDISVGTPIANRHRTETEALIGFFVNTLVIRADLSGDPTFRELLRRVRKVTTEAFAHQALPFSKVVEALNPDRSLSHSPLFQVMLGLGNTPTSNLEIPGLKLKDLSGRVDTAMFDLYMLVAEAGERFAAFVIYRTDLFEPATVERLLGHFETLLRGIVEDPDRQLSELPLLTPAEREQVLRDWADGGAEPREERCFQDWIAARAARVPAGIALVTPEGDVTLGALNRQANRLAHHLIALGVGPEARVGLCLADRAAMIAGMLAVLKSGGAYVPLDPAYPRERLAFLAEDARLAAVLVDGRTAGLVPDLPGLSRV